MRTHRWPYGLVPQSALEAIIAEPRVTSVNNLCARILFNARHDSLGQLVEEDFLVLVEGVAFGSFAARAEEIAELASQSHLLLVRTFHFAFADQNA